jgi:hypothetical protein
LNTCFCLDGVGGANPNLKNRDGRTPLMLASSAVASGGDTSKMTQQIEELEAEATKLKKKPKKKRKKVHQRMSATTVLTFFSYLQEDNARLEELEPLLEGLHASFILEAEKERCDQDQLLIVQTLLMHDAILETRYGCLS